MRRLALLFLMLLPLGTTGCGNDDARGLRLATTTSTRDSGLLDWLLEPFEAETGIDVQVVGVGTGQALALGERGDADLLLVHARSLEDAFIRDGHGVERRDVMWNDFLIAGPDSDPAEIRALEAPTDALASIASHGARFISRGDGSGTHERELQFWGGNEPAWDGYWRAGQGMGACLTMADEKQAYVLVDRGTFLAFRHHLDLVPLLEGDEGLRNPYGMILVNPARHPHVAEGRARQLLDWLTSAAGQARIAAFRVDGRQLFHPVERE